MLQHIELVLLLVLYCEEAKLYHFHFIRVFLPA